MRPTERIAGAPISWGVSEVPGWGRQLPPARVLEEMRAVGLAATEAGPEGFLPDDPRELRDVLARHDMELASGFTPLVLHGEERRWREALDVVARRFAAAGAGIVVLAAASGLDDYDDRPALSEDDWRRLLRALDGARDVAAGHGLDVALHPHYGTMVERPEEIDRVVDGCSVALCLDTGHVALGGGDPVALTRRVPERMAHVHLKDVDARLAGQVAGGELAFSDAVRAGVFRPLGAGDVDLPAILASLRESGYAGWFVFEQDVMLQDEPPPGKGPCEDVATSLAFLRATLG
jgi:inosose dehydratase